MDFSLKKNNRVVSNIKFVHPEVFKVNPCSTKLCIDGQQKNQLYNNFKGTKYGNSVNFSNLMKISRKKLTKKYFKWIVLLLLLLMISTVICAVILLSTNTQDFNVCTTIPCIESASLTLKYLNTSVDPCEDFYEFACGNFPKETRITEDIVHQSISSLISDTVTKQVQALLEELPTENLPDSEKRLKQLYNLCLNHSFNQKTEIANLKWIFQQLGDWPMLNQNSWNEKNFDLVNITHNSRQLGVLHEHFVTVTIEPDVVNTSKPIINIQVKKLIASTFSNDTEFPENTFTEDMIINSALLFGCNESVINHYVSDIKKFERKLHWIYSLVQDETNIKIKVKLMESVFSGIDWVKYVNNTIDSSENVITGEEVVLVRYTKRLSTLMNLLRATPKRVQANYMFLEIVRWVSRFQRNLTENSRTDAILCSKDIINSMDVAISSMYVKKYFNPKTKTVVTKLMLDIQEEFINVFKTTHWLDEISKNNAIEKLQNIKTCIGYPDELLDEKNLENYYSKLKINLTTYLNAMMSINRFKHDQIFRRLKKSVEDYIWIDNSAKVLTANSHNKLLLNSIMIPATLLQGFAFHLNRPRYMNYAIVGMIIGHQIMYAFDESGMQFSKDGSIKPWSSNTTRNTYKLKTQCFIDQYENYHLLNTKNKIHSMFTKEEGVAINCGLMVSHMAYNSWVNLNGNEETLPGLNFTPNQMFWISFSQFFCSHTQQDKHVLKPYETLNKYRVISTVSNFINFSRDFNCPLESPMNPEKKCKIW